MKAIIREQYGDPSVLGVEEVERPEPKADEIQLRVHATTINRTDVGHLTGKPYVFRLFIGFPKPKYKIPGTDFAGQVMALGKDVNDFQVGDRVWGLNDVGLKSHAQFMCIRTDQAVAHIPDGFDYEEAVACAEGAHYALNFINKVDLKEGDKVLVNGGTGAIGSAAVQLLVAKGIAVTAVCGTPHLDLLKSLGAGPVIDYLKEDFTQLQERFAFIFDAVGKSSFPACKHLLLEKGIYISSELGPGAQNLYLPLYTKLKGGKRVIFPFPSDLRKSIYYLSELMTAGKFKAVIDKRYTMGSIAEGYDYVMSGQKVGNVILTVGGEGA